MAPGVPEFFCFLNLLFRIFAAMEIVIDKKVDEIGEPFFLVSKKFSDFFGRFEFCFFPKPVFFDCCVDQILVDLFLKQFFDTLPVEGIKTVG